MNLCVHVPVCIWKRKYLQSFDKEIENNLGRKITFVSGCTIRLQTTGRKFLVYLRASYQSELLHKWCVLKGGMVVLMGISIFSLLFPLIPNALISNNIFYGFSFSCQCFTLVDTITVGCYQNKRPLTAP
jgi:hypothetical protein